MTPQGPCMSLPLNRKQLYQYGELLTKGIFFIKTSQLLSKQYFICVDIISHSQVLAIKEFYRRSNGTEAFDDLSQNTNFSNINGESFMFEREDSKEMMICMNRTIIFHIKLLEKNRANHVLFNQAWRKLYVP